ncbi:MAG TPA: hypothetical protein VHO70_22095 [Chitinispirillaceae bacterium]|nr:hypothetical protein [Chitinispirillaceae bacterium]
MKVFYPLLIILSVITVSFSDQQQKKSLGIKIGPYFSTIRYFVKDDGDKETHTFETKTSPSVSFCFELPQNRTIVHSFALNYYKNSGKETISIPFYSQSYTVSLQYLGLGYNFKANAHFDRITPYFLGGLMFDFLVSFDRDGYYSPFNPVNKIYPIDDDDVDPFTARAILGGGVEYNFDRVSVLLEYGFSYNLIPFYSWKNDDESVRYNYTAYGSTLSFGVKIPF